MATMAETATHPSPITKIQTLARDIKLSHSIFAMPWAVFAAFVAARGWPLPGQLGLIVICMVTARTVAMTANRLLDAQLDAKNPRTARRAIPSGALSRPFVGATLVLCAGMFVAGAALFWIGYHNPWPLLLSGPVLLFVVAYPLLKKFTRLCHYYLGAALGLAPVCAWIAIRGDLSITPLLMAGAVLLWTAGFDIIYACQDYEADVRCGLFSVPSRIGIGPALWVSRLTHLGCIGLMITIGFSSTPPLGPLYFTGVGIAIVLMLIEHAIVGPDDLSKVGVAFFTINGIISLILGTLGVLDVLSRGR
jgi:4-hydroxybenzoate polyprenyltransferase